MTKLLLTNDQIEALTELKEYFKDSITHIDSILKSDNIQTNLEYLIRDHNIESHNRNEVIKSYLKTLKNLLNQVEVLNHD